MYAVFKVRYWLNFYQSYKRKNLFSSYITGKTSCMFIRSSSVVLFLIWRPPALPHRLQCSTIGRLRLNRRVRDGNGCFPQAHRHQKSLSYKVLLDNSTVKHIQFSTSSSVLVGLIQPHSQPTLSISLERRWSSRTFRYGYLVTTSPQSSVPPSAAPPLRLGHWLRALLTPMVWRAVCTRPGNVFTAAFWSAITSDSSFV